jgi:LysM repeat protein
MGLTKLQIEVLHTGERINALFNPEEYSVNQDNNFAVQPVPGLSGPLVQFVNGNMRTLEMELLFDTYDTPTPVKRDVRLETGKVLKLMDIDPALHAPPLLRVSWASLQFRCVLARANQKFQMFGDDGKPVRARVTCTFNEVIDPAQEAKEVKRQTADYTKVHVVTAGETLSGIAAQLYDDPQAWRPIAIANGISDPRDITPGQALRVPSLPYTDPLTLEAVN